MILTSVPSNKRKPGTYIQFDTTSAARGLVPINWNVVLLGNKTSAGTATALTTYLVESEGQADTLFGIGSELALSCRASFAAARQYGNSPAIYAVPIADVVGAAQTRTLTVTGTATATGDIVIAVAGRIIRVGVNTGDVQNTVAASINAAFNAANAVGNTALPATSGVATNVATLTARHHGVNGVDMRVQIVENVAGVSIALGGTAGTGSYDITAALDTLVDRFYHGIGVANHTATDVSDFATHITNMSLPQTKKWPICVLAETASLSAANTLSTTANNQQIVVAAGELFPSMTGEIAAQMVTTLFAEGDPALCFDDVPLALPVPAAADVPTDTEIETALASGTSILSVNENRTLCRIVRYVTTKTTIGTAVFENLLDVTNIKSLIYTAIQVDAAWQRWKQQKENRKASESAAKRLRSVTLNVLRQEEALEILQNVEAHKGELLVEKDSIVKTRFNVAIPASVIPNLHQVVGVITLFVE
jgi:phage tail sheath gpL-like